MPFSWVFVFCRLGVCPPFGRDLRPWESFLKTKDSVNAQSERVHIKSDAVMVEMLACSLERCFMGCLPVISTLSGDNIKELIFLDLPCFCVKCMLITLPSVAVLVNLGAVLHASNPPPPSSSSILSFPTPFFKES